MVTGVEDAATSSSGGSDLVEAGEETEEMLGRVYFLQTRLSGRRLLRAWSVWRAFRS